MIALALIAAASPRILSADFCADQFAIALADPAEIAALSPEAERNFSYLRRHADGFPKAQPNAEQIVGREADLVLRFWGGDPKRFEALGVTTVTLAYAADFEAVKSNVRQAAAAIGRKSRGEAVIDDIDRRLGALKARGGARPTALYVTAGGVTAGRGTMVDSIFTAAGVRNAAGSLDYWPPLPAEALIADPPDLIVTGFFDSSEPANNWSAARHPALRQLFEQTPALHLPADVISCPGWFSLDAAEAIREFVDSRFGPDDGP